MLTKIIQPQLLMLKPVFIYAPRPFPIKEIQKVFSKTISNNRDANNKKNANEHSLALKDEKNPRKKKKRQFFRLKGKKNNILEAVIVSASQILGKVLPFPMRMMITIYISLNVTWYFSQTKKISSEKKTTDWSG